MRTRFLPFILLALAAVRAATDVCGILDIPATWTKEESPYRITGDIQIPPASRLTIEAGVTVLVATGEACGETKQIDWSDSTSISIKAFGPIVIKGEPSDPVVFMPENHVPGKVQWDGIRLPLKGINSVSIEYVHIMGANKAINASFSKFNIGNSLFIGNNTGIWLENEADLSIYNCIFTENLSAGIYLKNSRPSIAANIFYKNLNYGIWSDSRPSTRIQNNLFFANADTDCRYCPVGTSKVAKGEKNDKFGNIFADPVFANSDMESYMKKRDPNMPTPKENAKDTVLKQIYEKSQGVKDTVKTEGILPYSLSKYSPALNAAPKTEFFKNQDESIGDIGLHGGKPNRYNKPISF